MINIVEDNVFSKLDVKSNTLQFNRARLLNNTSNLIQRSQR